MKVFVLTHQYDADWGEDGWIYHACIIGVFLTREEAEAARAGTCDGEYLDTYKTDIHEMNTNETHDPGIRI